MNSPNKSALSALIYPTSDGVSTFSKGRQNLIGFVFGQKLVLGEIKKRSHRFDRLLTTICGCLGISQYCIFFSKVLVILRAMGLSSSYRNFPSTKIVIVFFVIVPWESTLRSGYVNSGLFVCAVEQTQQPNQRLQRTLITSRDKAADI